MGYACKDVEKAKKIAKKFVCHREGAELYSIGLIKFQELAKKVKVVYKMISKEIVCWWAMRYNESELHKTFKW